MSLFKCKMCGGELHVEEGMKVVECQYCGTSQTISSSNDEKILKLYARGNLLRTQNEFDKAYNIFEQIVVENPKDAEGYWNLLLCKYGITYVDDYDGSKKPTINRMSMTSVKEDQDYLKVIENADAISKIIYEKQALEIVKIQENILKIIKNEKPYDIFISYKETDEYGDRTEDSVLAQEIYDTLTKEGYKVFLSRITLSNAIGSEYEPYIYSALYSSKLMILVTTREEYVNAVWVKNEWSRFLKMMKEDSSKKIIPCFKYVDPYDLPKEIRNIQSVNFDKLGALQDLTIGVNKIIGKQEESSLSQQKNSPFASLYERLEELVSNSNFTDADKVLEQLILFEPNNGILYLYKLMIINKLPTINLAIKKYDLYIRSNSYTLLNKYNNDDNPKIKKFISDVEEYVYNEAIDYKNKGLFESAVNNFKLLNNYKDSNTHIKECYELLSEKVYELLSNSNFIDADKVLEKLILDKPNNGILYLYKLMIINKLPTINLAIKKYDLYIRSDSYVLLHKYNNDYHPKIKKFISDVEEHIYDKAIDYKNKGLFGSAVNNFRLIGKYKDSATHIKECNELLFAKAQELKNRGLFLEAIETVKSITYFPGIDELITECQSAIESKIRFENKDAKIKKMCKLITDDLQIDKILHEIDELEKINYSNSQEVAHNYRKQILKIREKFLLDQKKKKILKIIAIIITLLIIVLCNVWSIFISLEN